ncbi:MAG TPA: type II toxin-antitoxin system VapC family toxin [Nitrospira sp.]|nr:type II toxin-antitoxin system VapC family toxin [Nitrospira sp.]
MALPISGKVVLDTNVLIDFLRAGMYAEWVLGGHGTVVRFISATTLLELRLGVDSPKRKKAIDRLHQAFQYGRVLGLTPSILDRAGQLFRAIYGNASGLRDRLGPLNDILIALTAREIGATVVTNNVLEFRRIAGKVPGLNVAAP